MVENEDVVHRLLARLGEEIREQGGPQDVDAWAGLTPAQLPIDSFGKLVIMVWLEEETGVLLDGVDFDDGRSMIDLIRGIVPRLPASGKPGST